MEVHGFINVFICWRKEVVVEIESRSNEKIFCQDMNVPRLFPVQSYTRSTSIKTVKGTIGRQEVCTTKFNY
ncbi:hypothetical protein LINPERHAP1_LOCUS24070 [Linum perenne]